MENHLTSIGIFIRQPALVNILVLIQKTPFTDLQYKEINGLFKKGIFIVIIKKYPIRRLYI